MLLFQSHKALHSFYSLSFNIHLCPGLEFHLKSFLVGCNLFNQPPHQQFIILRDLCGLGVQKFLHLLDPLFQAFTLDALKQGILLQFTQAVNLIHNAVVVLFGIRQLEEFLLQLHQLGVNAFR